ncbi:MAG: hypothetical protein K8I29_19295 [Alphaproteobacteria bacterium]|uniref:Uncharacterized protein n=1 Tax=Candidatus Nitrobium versatile TaxID=2884831 RepID=A0A953M3R4_9BACT|nr:hypothetical protein [Candidatus Nitrobium versatile]
MKLFIPERFVASSVPFATKELGAQDPLEAAYHEAVRLLDDENVRLIASTEGEYVYFIAGRARDFEAAPESGTPLANALPQTPDHRGDGLYCFDNGEHYLAVEKKADKLKAYSMAKGREGSFGQNIYPVDTMTVVPWEGYRTRQMQDARKITRLSINIAAVIAVVNILLITVFSIIEGYAQGKTVHLRDKMEENMRRMGAVVQENTFHPLRTYLNDIQMIDSRSKKIDVYRVENGKVSWTAHFPKWISSEDYELLGRDLKKEERDDGIIVTKGTR